MEDLAAPGAMDAERPPRGPVVDPRGRSRGELLARIPPELCVRCKGARLLCGLPRCPILDAVRERLPPVRVKGRELAGPSPPSLFVGRSGYPVVRLGPLLSPAQPTEPAALDDPPSWLARPAEELVALRAGLVRGSALARVTEPRAPNRVLEAAQLLAMASSPAEVEVTLRKPLDASLQPRLDAIAAPMGPSVEAERARVVGNPNVPRKVDALVADTDARASDAVAELREGGVSAYHIQRLLSAGLLGRGRRRRLVPTRWSITATDDVLGQGLAARVKGSPELGEVELHRSEHHGNRFWVLLMPRAWSFEMLERWHAGSVWARESAAAQDWEPWRGRTGYAENVGGAYYAARLSVLEHLAARRRQAMVVVYREVTPAYLFPLGVWVIREAVRDAMERGARAYDSLEAAVRAVAIESGRAAWHRDSVLLRLAREQRRIEEYAAGAKAQVGGVGGGT